MPIVIKKPSLQRGTVFDLGILAANILLMPLLTRLSRNDGESNPIYAMFQLAAILLYCVGAALKRYPLQYRLATSDRKPTPMSAYICLFILLIMQFGLSMISFTMAQSSIKNAYPSLQWIPPDDAIISLLLALTAATLPVFYTIRALLPPPGISDCHVKHLATREWIADHLLYIAALIFLSIWDGMFMEQLAGRGPYNWFMGTLLIVLITVPFAVFYAAPRILFFAEDYRKPATYFRICAVLLPLSLRLLS